MTTRCNNTCLQLRVTPPYGEEKFANGRKFCSFCGCFMVTSENRCCCCRLSLRTKARNKRMLK
jgi:hypothetical protein